jgi:hypothetical protein
LSLKAIFPGQFQSGNSRTRGLAENNQARQGRLKRPKRNKQLVLTARILLKAGIKKAPERTTAPQTALVVGTGFIEDRA